MTWPITLICSMATRHMLEEMAADYGKASGRAVEIVSVGGVDAAKRVRAGEAFDLVVLASDAMQALAAEGFVIGDTLAEFARSPSAVAVPAGAARARSTPLDDAGVRALISEAQRIGVSSGPSGRNMTKLLGDWGWPSPPARQIVQTPPGVPVARLLASSEADIGFQQLSELLHEPGIEILGTVPETILPVTTFSIALARSATDPVGGQDVLQAFALGEGAAIKRRHGMEAGQRR